MKTKILIGTGIGILAIIAIIAVVLISGCVEITDEQAIAIANSTHEVQEFLKLYPDAKLNVKKCIVCTIFTEVGGLDIFTCKTTSMQQPGWIITYSFKTEYNKKSIEVKIGINAETGEILAKYPKLEYIEKWNYCENDADCITPKDEHLYSCDCTNFIQPVPIWMSCRGVTPLNCKCQNNTCTTLNKQILNKL